MITCYRLNNIILIGMPGSGKTTIGKILAEKLNYQFIDTDQLIFADTGKSPKQIVEENGVDYFVEKQDQIILSVNQKKCIISTGGGVVNSEPAMKHLKQSGLIIYLETSYNFIEERMDKSRRLLKTGGSLKDLYNLRDPLYRKYADIIINCDNTNPNLLCEKILEKMACD